MTARIRLLIVAVCGALCVGAAIAAVPSANSTDALVAALNSAHTYRNTIETTQDADGHTKVVVRGKFFDGRAFLQALFANLARNDATAPGLDLDLDIKVNTLSGFNGEALRHAELRFSQRAGELRDFALAGKLGKTDVKGELRTRSDSRRMIYLEANDAGAFLRLVNVYPRVQKGRLLMAMAAPTAERAPQDGVVSLRDFVLAEPALRPLLATGKRKQQARKAATFSRLRVAFASSAGTATLSDGHMSGTAFAASVEGKIDFPNDQIAVRGVLLPQFHPGVLTRNVKPELLGLDYRIAGSLQSPRLTINTSTVVTPRFLRQFFHMQFDGLDLMP